MITLEQYVGSWAESPDWTDERRDNFLNILCPAMDKLEAIMIMSGVVFPVNPVTGSGVSGGKHGGFRPQDCKVGAQRSLHKQGLALDRYDPDGVIDAWCLANSKPGGHLARCGIYIEHPSKTEGWSHWQAVPPKSGRIVFLP